MIFTCFSEDQANADILWLTDQANANTEALQEKLNKEKANCLKLTDAVATYDGDPESDEFKVLSQAYSGAVRQYKSTLEQYYHCYSPAYYRAGLPKPLTTAATDASGNFAIQVPKTGFWVLGASEHVANTKEPEGAFWLLRVSQDSITQRRIELDSHNSSASGSVNSLIKTMDQPTIKQIVSKADYFLRTAN